MARTHVLDRWLYRGRRAHWLARRINGATARVAAAGRGPSQLYMLEVRGRRSGKMIRFPVVVAEYESERYLVSMLGDNTNWVRNVRAAAGSDAIRGRGLPLLGLPQDTAVAHINPLLKGRPPWLTVTRKVSGWESICICTGR